MRSKPPGIAPGGSPYLHPSALHKQPSPLAPVHRAHTGKQARADRRSVSHAIALARSSQGPRLWFQKPAHPHHACSDAGCERSKAASMGRSKSLARPSARAQMIDCPAAREHEQPSHRRALFLRVSPSQPPDSHANVERYLLCGSHILHDSADQAQNERARGSPRLVGCPPLTTKMIGKGSAGVRVQPHAHHTHDW